MSSLWQQEPNTQCWETADVSNTQGCGGGEEMFSPVGDCDSVT